MFRPNTHVLALAFVAALAACNESNEVPGTIRTETPAPATPTPDTSPIRYECEPQRDLTVSYDNSGDTSIALLTMDGTTYPLGITMSASGAKYITEDGLTPGKTLVWWTKGDDGTLYEGDVGSPDDTEVMLAECSPAAG